MLGKTLRNVLLGSGLAATIVSFAPAAFAGAGGIAGSAAFTVTGTGVTGVATAAAIGMNGASAWAFNDATTNDNSAGAIGSAGAITITTFGSTSVVSVVDSVPTAYGTQSNTLSGAPDIKLGDGAGDVVVDAP